MDRMDDGVDRSGWGSAVSPWLWRDSVLDMARVLGAGSASDTAILASGARRPLEQGIGWCWRGRRSCRPGCCGCRSRRRPAPCRRGPRAPAPARSWPLRGRRKLVLICTVVQAEFAELVDQRQHHGRVGRRHHGLAAQHGAGARQLRALRQPQAPQRCWHRRPRLAGPAPPPRARSTREGRPAAGRASWPMIIRTGCRQRKRPRTHCRSAWNPAWCSWASTSAVCCGPRVWITSSTSTF